jgi:hypothetical protein
MEITIRVTSPRGGRRLLAILVAAVLLAVPTATLGNHLFTDVPDSNQFHGNITDIRNAGVTAGCGGGKFCPRSAITREQEAAFLSRGLGRAAMSTITLDSSMVATDGWVTVAALDVIVPGVGGIQRIVIDGEVTAVTDSGGLNDCGAGQRCYVNTRIRDATSLVTSQPGYYAYPPDTYHQELVGRQALFTVPSGPRRFELQVDLINGSDALQFASPTIVAMSFALPLSQPPGGSSAGDDGTTEAPDIEVNGGL